MKLQQITFNLAQREVTFHGGYSPSRGPLPTIAYPLLGYWEHEGVVLKAFFRTEALPTHEGEPILYRYEAPHVSHQGQAKYRYFTVPGYAGMMLSQAAYTQVGLPIKQVFNHLQKEVNQRLFEEWKQQQEPEMLEEYGIVEVPDRLGSFAPAILILSANPVGTELEHQVERESENL